jgi:glutaconate CoA-transferase subunit B
VTAREIADRMVWQLARQCRDDDVLIVGVATPIAAAAGMLARELLVPDLTVLVAASAQPLIHDIAQPMLAADYVAGISAGTLGQAEVLDLIARGGVSLQFVSPAQIDLRGRLNVSAVRRPDGTVLRLPGPLAVPDVSALVGRLVGYRAAHSPRLLVGEVDYVTGTGSADLDVRERGGLSGRGIDRMITDRAVLRFVPSCASVMLESVAAWAQVREVVDGCGFALEATDEAEVEDPPPPDAIELLERVLDPHGVREMEVPAGRAAAQARVEALSR